MGNIDELTYTGLQTKDNTVLVTEIQNNLQTIYGANGEQINFNSNTPDGNFTEVISELGTVMRELITEVYNSCDPSKCSGAVQDSRYQINYLFRKAGTFTRQNINITVDRTVTLEGLDEAYNDENGSAYAVSDDAGNIWYLIDTTTLYAGTTSCPFRAKNIGEVIPTIGTITNQVTIVQGVVSVINSIGYTILGENQESDEEFRIRREQSVSNSSINNEDAIKGQILALDGVTECTIHVNKTNTTDTTGTLPHYIWCIVGGGANTDIANVIYSNLGGAGTRGSVSIPITTTSMQTYNINFDRPTLVPLYIQFDLQPVVDLGEINLSDIKQYIADNLIYSIGEDAETSKVTNICTEAINNDGGGAYALNVEISTGGTTSTSTTSTDISNISVINGIFQNKVNDTAGSYVFTYSGSAWELGGDEVNLEDYGITYSGTPSSSDTLTVVYTASVWEDYISSSSIQDRFITDISRITINIIQ